LFHSTPVYKPIFLNYHSGLSVIFEFQSTMYWRTEIPNINHLAKRLSGSGLQIVVLNRHHRDTVPRFRRSLHIGTNNKAGAGEESNGPSIARRFERYPSSPRLAQSSPPAVLYQTPNTAHDKHRTCRGGKHETWGEGNVR